MQQKKSHELRLENKRLHLQGDVLVSQKATGIVLFLARQ